VYLDELRFEVQTWQTDSAPSLAYLLVPEQYEQRLRVGQPLNDDEAAYLFNLLKECEAGAEGDDENAKSKCRFAATGTLVALGGAWLAQNAEAQKHALEVVRAGVAAALSSDASALSQDAQARQALVEIAAALATMNIPTALTLQEPIKQLR
jgi:hypothetical protein